MYHILETVRDGCTRPFSQELHAHLNGSLSNDTLKKLQKMHGNNMHECSSWKKWDAIIDHGEKRTLEECFELFNVAHSLTTSPDAVQLATTNVIKEFDEDGVVYLELRSTPRQVVGVMARMQYIQAIVQAIRDYKSRSGIIVNLLVSLNRADGPDIAKEVVHLVLDARDAYPDIVVGLDLSGNPTKGTFTDYIPALSEARDRGLKLAIHCGEVSNTQEVQAILEFGPDRLGHATCIHPSFGGSLSLWKILLDSRIPVELCPTSNVKTMSVKNYKEHHFEPLYHSKHPISICTDDMGVFATSLSQEYQHLASAHSLNTRQIFDLSLDSIKHSFASHEDKMMLHRKYSQWKLANSHYFP